MSALYLEQSDEEQYEENSSDKEYETWLHNIPEECVGYVVGKGARNLNHVMSETNTYITTQKIGDKTYFVIEGEPDDRYSAKLKLKTYASICQSKNEGLSQSWFPCVDGKEGTYELQPCDYQGYQSTLVLKSPIKDYSGRDNYNLLLQELSKILQQNEEQNRSSNIWCHFGKIYIKYLPEEREYTLPELESHLMPRRLFAPEETKWRLKFFSGINHSSFKALDNLVSSKTQAHVPYKRKDITFCTPSCRELRLKVFMDEHSSESGTVYKNAKCPHEIHNVIKSSSSSPYFYICQSNLNNRTALVDIVEPSANVDIRLITESNSESFSEDVIYKEADLLYEYVKMNLRITEQGEVDLPSENCPPDFDAQYNRTSYRDTRVFYSSEEVTITARLSMETHDSGNDLDIHLDIEGCSKMTPDEIIDKVPRLLSCARDLAREITISDENEEPDTVPPEILARGPQAQSAYRYALKSGKVKNPRLSVVLVGQSRSGKTSLLRSLNGEKFNLSEDSTVGAKLQRSLSKVEDGDWEKNHNDESLLYNQCAAMELAKHLKLMKLVRTNTDDQDDTDRDLYDYDCNSLQNNQREYATEVDSAENNSARSVEPRPLQLQEDPEMVDENATQNMDNAQTNDSNVYQHELPDEVAMHTAHILEHPDAENQMENHLFFHTMDFAGQPVYSVTHPVFLPPKGIYLLVHSLENDLHAQATPIVKSGAVERKTDHDPMTNVDHLKFWLSLIDANSTQEECSPVFVVSTHADKAFEADVEHTARKIRATLREEEFAPRRHVVHDKIYTVDNTVSGSSSPEDAGVKELKAQIRQKAKSLPQMNEDIPVRWLLFEKKLKHLVRDEKRKHISLQEAETIALQCEVYISSDELETLLDYLHDLKVIIHFPETGMIIIDTQWLLDMFAKVITVQPIEYHGEYEHEWRKLEDQGIIDVKFLKHLWKDLLNDDTSVESLITIMERFSLICKQRNGSFLVPAMLTNSSIDESHELMKSDDCASPLVVRFKSSHLPLGLFPRLLIAVDEMCNLKCKSSTPPHLSRNFARFYIHSDDKYEFSLVFMADTATIAVALIDDVSQCRSDDVYVQQCKSILEFLRETLEKMVTSFPWMKSLAEFDFCIRCPICLTSCKKHKKIDCYRDSCVHLVSHKELLKTTKPRCQKKPKLKRNVIPDTSYSHWFPRSKCQSQEVKKDVKNTPEAPSLSSRKDEDNRCTDIMPLLNLMSSMSMDEATEKAKKIAVHLKLDKNSVKDPPDDIKRMSRKFCREMIARGQSNCVEALRNELPSGMTGPLQVKHDLLVKDMKLKIKQELSEALTVKETEWKTFAKEQVGLSTDKIEFLNKRENNPVLKILNEHCGDWSVDVLYTAIVDCGANAIADCYL